MNDPNWLDNTKAAIDARELATKGYLKCYTFHRQMFYKFKRALWRLGVHI